MPVRDETRTQRLEVIDLAVEGDDDRAVLVRHRLVAERRHVDDGEPAEPEANASIVADEQTFGVGAAMFQTISHRNDRLSAYGRAVERQFTANAAHRLGAAIVCRICTLPACTRRRCRRSTGSSSLHPRGGGDS